MASTNEALDAARLAIRIAKDQSCTIFDAVTQAMSEKNMPLSDYTCFAVGRYVGELLERSGRGHGPSA